MSTALLDPEPFRVWYREQKAKGFRDEEIARRFGLDARTLRRWRKGSEHIRRGELEDALMRSDLSLWDIYPDLEETEAGRTHGYCTGCKEDVPVDRELDCLWCGRRTWRRRSGVDQSGSCKLTDTQLRHLHGLNSQGVTIRELGRRVWSHAGYSGYQSAENAIRRGFRRLGLPVLKPGVALRRCQSDRTTRVGKVRCGKPPMVGSDLCMQHDKERRDEVLAITAKAFEAWRRGDREVTA